MKRRMFLVPLMALSLVVSIGGPSDAAVFGSGPFTATRNAVAPYVKCGLKQNQLTALVLAMTWPEVTANNKSLVPSPMTLSRYDKKTYFQYPGGAYPRDYWHPGIGMWQVDDAGMGVNMSYEKFLSGKTAAVTASYIANQYCAHGLSGYYMYRPWVACNGGSTCLNNYYAIYNKTYDTISLSKPTISENGGSKGQSCRLYGHTTRFYCVYVNPANAEGYVSFWRDAYPNGTSSMSPVSKAFYIYAQVINGVTYETRVWPKQLTGYSTSIYVRRAYGKPSRTSGNLRWSSWSTGTRLCVKATSTSTEVCY